MCCIYHNNDNLFELKTWKTELQNNRIHTEKSFTKISQMRSFSNLLSFPFPKRGTQDSPWAYRPSLWSLSGETNPEKMKVRDQRLSSVFQKNFVPLCTTWKQEKHSISKIQPFLREIVFFLFFNWLRPSPHFSPSLLLPSFSNYRGSFCFSSCTSKSLSLQICIFPSLCLNLYL